MQLKGWIKNKSKLTGAHPNVLLQSYMLERFLERVSLSPYRENVILKGGFLIASMVGIGKRSTMDIDTTVKGLAINRESLEGMLREVIAIDVADGVSFDILDIQNIHDINEYDDFRISLLAVHQTIRINMTIDVTTGDTIIPCEIEYHYKLMFEDRTISVMAYNLCTILAEKIETILKRSIGNTRGRDFYDVYLLLSTDRDALSKSDLRQAIRAKAVERGSIPAIESHAKILGDIATNPDIAKIWDGYTKRYSYAQGISLTDILSQIASVFEGSL
jgi:predicted nucleotidyltransferase component of viral defense system